MASDSQVGYKTIQQTVASSSKLVSASTSKLASEVNLSFRFLSCFTNDLDRTPSGLLRPTATSNRPAHNLATCARPRRPSYQKARVRMYPPVRRRSRGHGNTTIDGSAPKIERHCFGRAVSKDIAHRRYAARSSKHRNRPY